MNGPVQVILTGPAKIAGQREAVGAVVTVSYAQAVELGFAGAVAMLDGMPVVHEGDDAFNAAVAARAEDVAKELIPAIVEKAVEELVGERDKALAQAKAANDQADEADRRAHGFAQQAENLEAKANAATERAEKVTAEIAEQTRLAEQWFERAETAEAEVARLKNELAKAETAYAGPEDTPPESESAKIASKGAAQAKTTSKGTAAKTKS